MIKKSIYLKKLSVIIPYYNKNSTITKIIKKIIKTNLNLEIIIVDDFSSDGSKEKIENIKNKHIKKKLFHNKNLGKGACIKNALKYVTGDYVIIQDADLEYNPNDYKILLDTIINGSNDIVYGSRVLTKKRYSFKKVFLLILNFSNHVFLLFLTYLILKT